MTIHNFFIVYMEVIITKSKKKDKKFDATIDGKKTISFGAKGYTDFTQSKDPAQKQRYLNRHRAREDWTNPKTAGFYSANVLWNKTTIKSSVADINKKFSKLNIKLNI